MSVRPERVAVITQYPPECGFLLKQIRSNAPAATTAGSAVESLREGPGTELRKLLSLIGITQGDCNCAQRAAVMDSMGCDWCRSNIAMIVGWLEEAAAARKLPFNKLGAYALVRLAIWKARRKRVG